MNSEGKTFNNLYYFDISANTWYQPTETANRPCGRIASSIIGMNNKYYLFGGSSPEYGLLNDLWELDLSSI